MYTHQRFLPGSQLENSHLEDVLLAEGCWIQDAQIESAVIGTRSQIRAGSIVKKTVMMGSDYYGFFRRGKETDEEKAMGISRDCDIEGAIIDKNSSIGSRTLIRPFPLGTDVDTESYVVRDGIVVIPKGVRLPPDTRIAPD